MDPQRAHLMEISAEDCQVVTYGLARYNGKWIVEYEGKVLTEAYDPRVCLLWVSRLRRIEAR